MLALVLQQVVHPHLGLIFHAACLAMWRNFERPLVGSWMAARESSGLEDTWQEDSKEKLQAVAREW